jgi:hypothetical protein
MAADLVDRRGILVVVRRFLGMGAVDSRSLRSDKICPHIVILLSSTPKNLFRRFLGVVRREFLPHFVRRRYTFVLFRRFWGCAARILETSLCCSSWFTLGFYLRDALREGSFDNVACLHVPRSKACGFFLLDFPFSIGGFHCFFLEKNMQRFMLLLMIKERTSHS